MARLLAEGLQTVDGVTLLYPVEANELFVTLRRPVAQKLFAKGHQFYPWPAEGPDAYRLVTSFSTTQAELDGFLADL